jgi:hypothetical protein
LKSSNFVDLGVSVGEGADVARKFQGYVQGMQWRFYE